MQLPVAILIIEDNPADTRLIREFLADADASGRVAEVASLFAHIYREASVTAHAPLLTVPFESRARLWERMPAATSSAM